MLSQAAADVLVALRGANGAPFTELVRIAGLDPSTDLRNADLSGVDFAGCDLSGYDFSGAILANASFAGAKTESARFDRADLTGVRWAAGRRPDASPTLHSHPLRLRPWERQAVDVLTRELLQARPARALAVLPPGVGRTSIVAATFRALVASGDVARGLILTESVVLREGLSHRLREAGVVCRHLLVASGNPASARGEVIVDTFANYTRLRRETGSTAREFQPMMEISHYAFLSLPTRRRAEIAAIALELAAPSILAIADGTDNGLEGAEGRTRMRGRLRLVFDHVSFEYTLAQAIGDGVLRPADVDDRSFLVERYREHRGVPEERGQAVIEGSLFDFTEEIARLGDAPRVLLIVPDTDLIEPAMTGYREAMIPRPGGQPIHLVPISSRHGRVAEQRSAAARPGAVVVTTPSQVDASLVRIMEAVGVLAPLPDRVAMVLAYPPAAAGRGAALPVLDYVGSMSPIVERQVPVIGRSEAQGTPVL